MEKSEQLKTEEKLFLSLCNKTDREMLVGKIPMTVQNFERICYIAESMEFEEYDIYLMTVWNEQMEQLAHKVVRESLIMEGYPEYPWDEGLLDRREQWLRDFCSQLPNEGLREEYCRRFDLLD